MSHLDFVALPQDWEFDSDRTAHLLTDIAARVAAATEAADTAIRLREKHGCSLADAADRLAAAYRASPRLSGRDTDRSRMRPPRHWRAGWHFVLP